MQVLWGLATAIAYAITSVLIGQVCKKSHPLAVSLVVTSSTLLFFLVAGWLGPGIHIAGRSAQFGVVIGILYAVGNVIYYKALAIGPMAMVSVTSSLAPVVPLGFDIASGKAPSSIQLIGFLLVALGLWLAARRLLSGRVRDHVGLSPLLLSVPASVLFGINDVLFELVDSAAVIGLLLVIQLSKLIATMALAVPVMGRVRSGSSWSLLKLFPLGGIYGLAWIFLDWSARAGSIDITSALEYSYPVFVALLAYIFLAERLSRRQAVGVCSALAGILLMVALPIHSPRHPSESAPSASVCGHDCRQMRPRLSQRLR